MKVICFIILCLTLLSLVSTRKGKIIIVGSNGGGLVAPSRQGDVIIFGGYNNNYDSLRGLNSMDNFMTASNFFNLINWWR